MKKEIYINESMGEPVFVFSKMDGWDPVVKGKHILDHDTGVAASRFLAGVIINLAG